MLEKYDLRPADEVMEENDLTPDDGEGFDEINCYEVYRKGNLVLYEYTDDICDSIIPEEIVNEIFPEYKTDSNKSYLIEE